MKLIGWITVFFLGLSIINIIAYRIKAIEKISFAFPIGMGANSIIFFIFELLHISLKSIDLIIGIELALGIVLSIITIRKMRPVFSFELIFKKNVLKKSGMLNLSWFFFMGVILFVAYIMIRKSLFWPIVQFDSIAGYDFVAKAMATEGTLNSSIFNSENPVYSIRSLYPPLAPINFGFAYLLGHTSSQIVVLIFFLCTISSFYLFLKRNSTHLCAAFFTLLLLITPEYAAFSTISSSNIPCTFYTSIGMLCLYTWFTEKDQNYFTIGVVLMAFAVWTRTEAIVFAAGGGFMILLDGIRNKKKIPLLIFGLACFAALALWQWYIKQILHASFAQPVLDHITWDPEKLGRMFDQIKHVTFSTVYFGATILLFIGMVVLNIKNIFSNRDQVILLISIFSTWLLYVAVFYFINTDYTSSSMEGWIFSGYKRGMFCFLPLILFYSANNKISQQVFNKYLSLP